jgi:hypothetical protein
MRYVRGMTIQRDSDCEAEKVSYNSSTRSTATTAKAAPAQRAASTPPSRQRRRAKDIPPDKVGNGGAVALLTLAVANRLINTVAAGTPLDVAIAYCGIHRETLRRWRRRGDQALEIPVTMRSQTERRYADFVKRLDATMAETTVLAQATLKKLIIGTASMTDTEKRIQADMIKFYLSRRERKYYGASVQAEMTGPNGGPVLSADLSGEEAWEALVAMFGDPAGDDDE